DRLAGVAAAQIRLCQRRPHRSGHTLADLGHLFHRGDRMRGDDGSLHLSHFRSCRIRPDGARSRRDAAAAGNRTAGRGGRGMTIALVLLALAAMLVIGLPVALAMAVSGAMGLYIFGGLPVLSGILRTSPLSTANSYEIITIPMFILMAEFVIISGVANDLFRSATIWVGRLKGGVAMA